jgi:hypothetical protein
MLYEEADRRYTGGGVDDHAYSFIYLKTGGKEYAFNRPLLVLPAVGGAVY